MRRAPGLVLLVLAALVVALLAGCGGSGGGSDDPASVAPADAPVYIQATLKPAGTLKSNTGDAISTITGESDPGKAIVEKIDEQAKSDGSDITYENDIKPWLGEKAGLFVDGFDNGKAAVILQVTNEDAAKAFEDKSVQISNGGGVKDASYNGVDYKLENDGDASGFVDGFLVDGDQAAFKEAVDASKGDGLADNSDFKDTIGRAPGDSLADVYVSVDAFSKAVQQQVSSTNVSFAKNIFGDTNGKTALASLIPAGDKIELDLSTNSGSAAISGGATDVISSFPAGSLAAIGVPDIGRRIKSAVDQLENSGIPGVTPGTIEQQLKARGIDLNTLTSSLGDLGVFIEGKDLNSFAGAVVITTSDPSGAQKVVSNLGTLLKQSGTTGLSKVAGGFEIQNPQIGPQPVIVKAVGGKIVAGYGTKATSEAAGGGSTLGDSQLYQNAVSALGSGVNLSAYVDVARFVAVSAAAGNGSDPQLQAAKPYLDHFTYLALGAGKSGEAATSKLIAGLQK